MELPTSHGSRRLATVFITPHDNRVPKHVNERPPKQYYKPRQIMEPNEEIFIWRLIEGEWQPRYHRIKERTVRPTETGSPEPGLRGLPKFCGEPRLLGRPWRCRGPGVCNGIHFVPGPPAGLPLGTFKSRSVNKRRLELLVEKKPSLQPVGIEQVAVADYLKTRAEQQDILRWKDESDMQHDEDLVIETREITTDVVEHHKRPVSVLRTRRVTEVDKEYGALPSVRMVEATVQLSWCVPMCSVCLKTWSVDDEVITQPCLNGNLFHHACLLKWLETHSGCPDCTSGRFKIVRYGCP